MASSSSPVLRKRRRDPTTVQLHYDSDSEKAAGVILRKRLCDPTFVHHHFNTNTNYSKLKFIISNSITQGCNNSLLLLGPRGNGKSAVLELVLQDLKLEHPDMLSLVRLNGLLHSEDNCGLKEIAKQLCLEHHLSFSKMASSDENSDFLIDMLRECGLAHKTLIFILEEFDLFAKGKQRLLYTLLDALQSLSSQAVVIGVSCRLDADQLLEKRVRSRFSHRKLLFVPPSNEDIERLLEHLLYLPKDADLSPNYVLEFNSRLQNMFNSKEFKDILGLVLDVDRSTSCLVMFLFRVVCSMDPHSGFLSLENFKTVSEILQRQPKLESIHSTSILELYILVCMNKLETKEQISYNFNSIMKEYNAIHDAYKTSDFRSREVCLRAFEHLLERGLIAFSDSSVRFQTVEYRPVKLLISSHELYQGLKAYNSCPVILLKLFNHESFK